MSEINLSITRIMRILSYRKELLIGLAVAMLSGWTAWYVADALNCDLPHSDCVIRQPTFALGADGATRTAVLSTSIWLDAGRIEQNGCYQHRKEDLSIDRSGAIQTLFHRGGEVLGRISRLAYSTLDNAGAEPVPGALTGAGNEVSLHFRKLTSDAWIVITNNNRAGMCVSQP